MNEWQQLIRRTLSATLPACEREREREGQKERDREGERERAAEIQEELQTEQSLLAFALRPALCCPRLLCHWPLNSYLPSASPLLLLLLFFFCPQPTLCAPSCSPHLLEILAEWICAVVTRRLPLQGKERTKGRRGKRARQTNR